MLSSISYFQIKQLVQALNQHYQLALHICVQLATERLHILLGFLYVVLPQYHKRIKLAEKNSLPF